MYNESNLHDFGQFSDEIELMVEGELSAEQRSELVARIEQNPQCWRDVALAFMEHQAISSAMRKNCRVARPDVEKRGTLHRHTDSLEAPARRRGGWMMRAASVLIALAIGVGIGRQVHELRVADGGQPEPQLSASVAETPDLDDATETAAEETDATKDTKDNQNRIVGYVQWLSDDGLRLSPVFGGTQIDNEWLKANPPQVNERMQKVMSRAGWQAQPERKFVSVKLTGGGIYTIPMDDVTWRYVGRQVF